MSWLQDLMSTIRTALPKVQQARQQAQAGKTQQAKQTVRQAQAQVRPQARRIVQQAARPQPNQPARAVARQAPVVTRDPMRPKLPASGDPGESDERSWRNLFGLLSPGSETDEQLPWDHGVPEVPQLWGSGMPAPRPDLNREQIDRTPRRERGQLPWDPFGVPEVPQLWGSGMPAYRPPGARPHPMEGVTLAPDARRVDPDRLGPVPLNPEVREQEEGIAAANQQQLRDARIKQLNLPSLPYAQPDGPLSRGEISWEDFLQQDPVTQGAITWNSELWTAREADQNLVAELDTNKDGRVSLKEGLQHWEELGGTEESYRRQHNRVFNRNELPTVGVPAKSRSAEELTYAPNILGTLNSLGEARDPDGELGDYLLGHGLVNDRELDMMKLELARQPANGIPLKPEFQGRVSADPSQVGGRAASMRSLSNISTDLTQSLSEARTHVRDGQAWPVRRDYAGTDDMNARLSDIRLDLANPETNYDAVLREQTQAWNFGPEGRQDFGGFFTEEYNNRLNIYDQVLFKIRNTEGVTDEDFREITGDEEMMKEILESYGLAGNNLMTEWQQFLQMDMSHLRRPRDIMGTSSYQSTATGLATGDELEEGP